MVLISSFIFPKILSSKIIASNLLIELGIIILIVTILGLFAASLKQPMIPVYILAGLLINYLSAHHIVFDKEYINSISELGIAFLLFVIGMEFDIEKIKNILGFTIIGGAFQIAFTSFLLLALLRFFSIPFKEGLIISIALSFSSTAIVVKYLSDKGTIDTIYGRASLGILLIQDLFVILIMPFLIPSSNNISLGYYTLDIVLKSAGLIAIALFSNRFIVKPLMKYFYKNVDVSFLISLSLLFIFSIISNVFGFSIAIGGFIGGLAFASYPYSYRVSQRIAHLRDFFIVLFFVALGLRMSLDSFLSNDLFLLGVLVIFTLIIKPFLYILPSLFFGNDAKNSLQLGILLSQTSEFSLILGSIAFSSGLLEARYLSIIGGVFFISSFLSSYLIQWSWAISSKLYRYFEFMEKIAIYNKKDKNEVLNSIKNRRIQDHVIIYGINSYTKVILEKIKDEKFLVVCDDISHVRVLRKEGYEVIFGSVEDEEFLNTIHIDKAKLFVYAKENFDELSEALTTLKSVNKNIRIIGRSNNFKQALKLYEGGIDFVLIDGKHNYEDLRKIIEYIMSHDYDKLNELKTKEINYLTKELEKEVLASHLPEELQEIKKKVMDTKNV